MVCVVAGRRLGLWLPAIGADDVVAGVVPVRQEPQPAAGGVIPPLGLLAGSVLLHVKEIGPGALVQAVGHRRARVRLTAVPKLGGVARAAVGAGEIKHTGSFSA